jgi:hypothetical protein
MVSGWLGSSAASPKKRYVRVVCDSLSTATSFASRARRIDKYARLPTVPSTMYGIDIMNKML